MVHRIRNLLHLVVLVATSAVVAFPLVGMSREASNWSSPSHLSFSLPLGGFYGILSCPSKAFCAVSDSLGNVYTYNGTRWTLSRQVRLGQEVFAVSCGNADSCEAMDQNGEVLALHNGSWSAPEPVFGNERIIPLGPSGADISCVTNSMCTAITRTGAATVLRDGSWHTPIDVVNSTSKGVHVSCAAGAFCMVVTGNGQVATYDGKTWRRRAPVSGVAFASLSCASPELCAAGTGNSYNIEMWNGNQWKSYSIGAKSVPMLSCPSSAFCMAVDGLDDAYSTYSQGTWSPERTIQHVNSSLVGFGSAVSCASVDACLTLFDRGYADLWTVG